MHGTMPERFTVDFYKSIWSDLEAVSLPSSGVGLCTGKSSDRMKATHRYITLHWEHWRAVARAERLGIRGKAFERFFWKTTWQWNI